MGSVWLSHKLKTWLNLHNQKHMVVIRAAPHSLLLLFFVNPSLQCPNHALGALAAFSQKQFLSVVGIKPAKHMKSTLK